MKKTMRKVELTKYIENLYYIIFAVTGTRPTCIKRETEDKIVRVFDMIDRLWPSIERDRRRSFLNHYYILSKLLELMGQTEMLPQAPLLKAYKRKPKGNIEI